MYAIMGITGQIGSAIGRILLAAKQPVRAVVRDAGKGQIWADRGCEIALANIEDTASLTNAFRGVEGVFVLVPPNFDPAPGFPEARATAASLSRRLKEQIRAESYTCRRSAHKRVNPTCLHSTPSSSRRWESCRCRLLSFDPHGSWRIFAGMSPRRERAGSS